MGWEMKEMEEKEIGGRRKMSNRSRGVLT